MFQDFIDYKLAITINNNDIYLLDDLEKELGDIKFNSGKSINSNWFIHTIRSYKDVYIVCKNRKIFFGENGNISYKKVSIADFLKISELNINENDFEEMFK